MWKRGPRLIFYLDFLVLLFLVLIMSTVIQNELGEETTDTWQLVFAMIFVAYLFMRDGQLAWELRRQDLIKHHLWGRSWMTQFSHAPLTFIGLSASFRYNLWNWMSMFMLFESISIVTTHVQKSTPAGSATAAISIMIYWLRLIGKGTNAHESYAVFVYMLGNIIQDIAVFILVLALVLAAFTHFFFILFYEFTHARNNCDDGMDDGRPCGGDFPEDDAVYDWGTYDGSFKNVVLLMLGIAGPSGIPDHTGEYSHELFYWDENSKGAAAGFFYIVCE